LLIFASNNKKRWKVSFVFLFLFRSIQAQMHPVKHGTAGGGQTKPEVVPYPTRNETCFGNQARSDVWCQNTKPVLHEHENWPKSYEFAQSRYASNTTSGITIFVMIITLGVLWFGFISLPKKNKKGKLLFFVFLFFIIFPFRGVNQKFPHNPNKIWRRYCKFALCPFQKKNNPDFDWTHTIKTDTLYRTSET